MKTRTTTLKGMEYAFTIYKEGMTTEPTAIIYPVNTSYDIERKILFYVDLGYSVFTELN